jgi:hypothetical protein
VSDFETLEAEVATWQERRDSAGGKKIDRRFPMEAARIKLNDFIFRFRIYGLLVP